MMMSTALGHLITFLATVGALHLIDWAWWLARGLRDRADMREMGDDYDRAMAAWNRGEAPR